MPLIKKISDFPPYIVMFYFYSIPKTEVCFIQKESDLLSTLGYTTKKLVTGLKVQKNNLGPRDVLRLYQVIKSQLSQCHKYT